MTLTTPPPAAPRRRHAPRLLQVLRTARITPHMQRVTLGGPGLDGYPTGRDGAHLKLLLPQPGQLRPELPTIGPSGPIWPARDLRPIVRTYTQRHYDDAARELDIDFALHEHAGVASGWAASAEPGDLVGIAGPTEPDEDLLSAEWCLLAGDLSALPAISAYLEQLPASARGHAFIEIPSAADMQVLSFAAQVQLTWLCRDGAELGASLLGGAVRALAWPGARTRTFAWLAGESSEVVALRNFLRAERGLTRDQMYAVPYWKAGLDEDDYHDERHRIMDESAAG